ncbi:MAG: hypothetical protein ISS35_02115 [Kiritimatiellae bacterium]|nr:hypothetical protein [Kiritimatiellia bacterium]
MPNKRDCRVGGGRGGPKGQHAHAHPAAHDEPSTVGREILLSRAVGGHWSEKRRHADTVSVPASGRNPGA